MSRKIKFIAPLILISIIATNTSCSVKETDTPSTLAFTTTPTSSPNPPTPTATLNPNPTATPIPDVEGTVQIWLDWTADEIEVLTPSLNAFHEKFPLVNLEISYYPPDEILDRYRQAHLEGNAPAILIGESQWGEDLFGEGMIREISDRIPEEMVDLIYPVAWESVRQGNETFGLPLSMEGIVLYRNPEIVDTRIDTLEHMADLLSDLEAENKTGTIIDLGFLYTGAFLSTCEGELVDQQGGLALNDRAVECWLRLLKLFGQSGSGTQNSDFDLELFKDGGSAWLVEGSWKVDDLFSVFGEGGVAIDPWPVYETVGSSLTGYAWTRSIYFNNSISDEEFDPAWVFARYLLTEEAQLNTAQADNGRQFPVLRNLEFEAEWIRQMMEAMKANIKVPSDSIFRFFALELEPAAFDVVRRKYDAYWLTQWAMSNLERAIIFRGGSLQ
jgi:maltose-binding protein MalE